MCLKTLTLGIGIWRKGGYIEAADTMSNVKERTAMQCTMQSFGTFSTPSFAGVGEPFIDTLSGDLKQPVCAHTCRS